MVPVRYYIYDLETYPNAFLWSGKFEDSPDVQVFEISFRKNQKAELLQWLSYLQNSLDVLMVGFRNIPFDYPITHDLLNNVHTFSAASAYQLCMNIINARNDFEHRISLKDRIIPQVDLALINHFDSMVKATSLKALQFAMRSESVEDLPFPVGMDLTSEKVDVLIHYNIHDITETEKYLKKCKHLIEIRRELQEDRVVDGDVLNYNDVKLGEHYLIKKIGRNKCFNGSKAKQTIRESVTLKEVILPKINFKTEPFQRVLDWFNSQIFYMKGDSKPSLETPLAGVKFKFGAGGVHASVENKTFKSNATHKIIDIDVSGMYVAVAIQNGFHPEHLGEDFDAAYTQLKKDRDVYPKGTSRNKVLKLSGNGVYGKSSDIWSCFYDPKYTFTVTSNGQLQLLQLAEGLVRIPGLELIQANTDGITALVRRDTEHFFNLWKSDWESYTGLQLEQVEYSAMWIRDVNNYLAKTIDGKVKRKGDYWYPENDSDYEGNWNKDFSAMIVPKVTEQVLVHDWNPDALIRLASDKFDFMLRYKTPSGAVVKLGDKDCSKTVRYYVSTKGEKMVKHSRPKGVIGDYKRKNEISDKEFYDIQSTIPAGSWDSRIHTKNKSKYEEIETSIESGYLVKCCNKASDFDWSDVDYSYYLKRVQKLLIGDQGV